MATTLSTTETRTSHTPGPWAVGELELSPQSDLAVTADDGRTIVAEIWDHDEDGSHAANARLIAAAPDLLEACRMVDLMMFINSLRRQFPEITDAVRAAIHKAIDPDKCSGFRSRSDQSVRDAAPELLAALQSLLSAVRAKNAVAIKNDARVHGGIVSGPDFASQYDDAKDSVLRATREADAAIRKATGETP